MNKEISDALHMLLHCALKDKEFETQKEQFEFVYKHIEELHNKIDKLKNENESLRTRIKTIKRLRKKQTQKKNKYKTMVIDLQNALTEKNNKIDKAIKLIEDGYYSKNTTDIDSIGISNNKLIKIREILKEGDVDD